MSMLLIVGLGNPGPQYALHRHNVGFLIVDSLQQEYNLPAYTQKFQGAVTKGQIEGHNVILLKPLTYMNNSGQSVSECARYYNIDIEDIIVIHDEIDIPFGKLKAKKGGGAGGHNGLRSIDQHLGQDYYRLRFGVGKPNGSKEVSNYVLQNFSKQEQEEIPYLVGDILSELPLLLEKNTAKFLSQVALRQQPVKQK